MQPKTPAYKKPSGGWKRVEELAPLKKAVIMSEVLGPPMALR
jgi:hypothetical protein